MSIARTVDRIEQRAQPPAQHARPLPGLQRRRAPGHRPGRGGPRPRRRRRAGVRRRGRGLGRWAPRCRRAAAHRAGRRALDAHQARAALRPGPAAVRPAGGVHVGRAGPRRGDRLGDRHHRARRGGGRDRRAAHRPALALGGLPRLDRHGRARPRRHVQLEPDLRPAALAADRPRGVRGHREPGRSRLLEGRGPRHVRRLQLGRRAPAATDAARAERGRPVPVDQDPSRLDRRYEDARCHRRRRSQPAGDEPPGGHRAGRRCRDLAVGGAAGPGNELRGLGLLAAPGAPRAGHGRARLSGEPAGQLSHAPAPDRIGGARRRSDSGHLPGVPHPPAPVGAARHRRAAEQLGGHHRDRPLALRARLRAWPAGLPPGPGRRTRS